MMRDPRETTAMDGAACVICGDDAVWAPTIAEGSLLKDVPLCGDCTDDKTAICPGCDHRIWQADGVRVYSTPDLYCRPCADKKEAAFVAGWLSEHRRDVNRDDFNDRRR